MRAGIVCYPSFGGSGVVASELANHLARNHGLEVHLFSRELPPRLDCGHVHFHWVEIPEYPLFPCPPYTLALASKIIEVAQRKRLDLLHVHYAVPHATAAYIARDSCCPEIKVITTLHGTDVYLVGTHPSYKPIVEFSMAQCDGLTAVSRFLKEATLENFNVTKEIKVIYNFVDPERFCRREEREKERIICHISNFRPVKRVMDTVRTFALISREIDSKLYMVGDGPEREPAEELARKLGVAERVIFWGNVTDVAEVLGKADLFLLPSEQESFGLAALEALSCEVPVVATRVGGLPEVVREGVDGYLVDVGDIKAMAERGAELLSDDALRERMGQQARRRVLEEFTPERIVPQYVDYYQEVLEG
jgi:N-acetyl-alpha-D-glucosaminyl L-malate synthase BshA